MKMSPILAAAAALTLGAGAAGAQPPMDHSKMAHDAKGAGPHRAMADKAFMMSMQNMDKAMMAAKGATVDATFAKKMIAHHEGAIAMARVELEHGGDAQAKQLAQKTIDENTRGIAELRDWLRQHGG
ncbi:MAG: DUF305 domain-containing protein [Phenylobacterium sp.]|uniref:DUF305 domain-containing protein n=1 Tax=Phenylobacterium sp. TaxID=1871053 RepID=UPI00122846EF|nr:DUF305 domain-containing protein [Phenylobacterium sp.]TAJ68790.1 MAG: DUF305 domain-containing protein [Phenylobacterium sp.]